MPTNKKISEFDAGTAPDAKTAKIAANGDKYYTGDQVIAGYRTIVIPAGAMTPRSANGCAALAVANGGSNEPDIPYLAFDGAAKEYAGLAFVLPQSYEAGTTLRARFFWRRASGTGAANVVLGLRGVAMGNSETTEQAFGSDATVTAAADTTTDDLAVSDWTGALTLANSPVPGDLVFLEAFRDGASGSDTLNAVDLHLIAIELQYTVARADDRVPA